MSQSHKMKPKLSKPFELVIGPSSPVQKAISVLRRFFMTRPCPEISSAQNASLLAANHLMSLMDSCGMLNGAGRHSAAVVMLRSLEDTLDIFCAITTVPEIAERWEKGNLKPSEASKLWVEKRGDPKISTGQSLGEYRKGLRNAFHKYAHASYELCLWDLYFNPKQLVGEQSGATGTIEINSSWQVIDSNGHAIDAHLTAHLLEFIAAVRVAFFSALVSFPEAEVLSENEKEIESIMQKHSQHDCQNVQMPAELRALKK
jgi:hypothetical protein